MVKFNLLIFFGLVAAITTLKKNSIPLFWSLPTNHLMSPKFGNILGSFGLTTLAQPFIFYHLCIIFLVYLCHLYE